MTAFKQTHRTPKATGTSVRRLSTRIKKLLESVVCQNIMGMIERDLYQAWRKRVSPEPSRPIPAEQIQPVFNEIGLYPSQSQVYEMLHCARERSQHRAATFLTFGEFCVFATELKRSSDRDISRPVQLSKMPEKTSLEKITTHERKLSKTSSNSSYEVFLGGSCNPTTWRADLAIPALKESGITFYNPQVSHWGPELIELEHRAKATASVLFFVIDRQTRSVASIIEAAHTAASQRPLVLVIRPYEGPGQPIWGEPISKQEYEDLTTGQLVLQDLVERQGIPVFSDTSTALKCTEKILRKKMRVQDLTLEDGAQPVKNAHEPIGDKLIRLRDAFESLDTANTGELTLAEVRMAFQILTNRNVTLEDLKNIATGNGSSSKNYEILPTNVPNCLNFDQFCCILSEIRSGQCQNRRLWHILLDKTATWVQHVVSPFSKVLAWALPTRPQGLASTSKANTDITMGGARDVYLGGSCGSTTWREDVAISLLKKNGMTYFNPQTSNWSRRLLPLEAAAMDSSIVLLFVITGETRSVSAMAMAAHYIGLGCDVVLCIQYLPESCEINAEKLSRLAVKDYNRGRSYLSDLANRLGIPVFEEVREATECAIQRCRERRQRIERE